MDDEIFIYERRVPHWRKRGATYDICWRIEPGTPPLAMEEREVVANALKFFEGERYDLHSYAVMNDHVHVLATPFEGWTLADLMHTWRGFSANKLQRQFGRVGDVWLEDYWQRIIRNETHFKKQRKYIFENPVRRWGITDYPYAAWKPLERERSLYGEHGGTEARLTRRQRALYGEHGGSPY